MKKLKFIVIFVILFTMFSVAVEAKNISVKSPGKDGDITQKIIDSIKDAKSGDIIIIPEGNFIVSKRIDIRKSGITITGTVKNGVKKTILKAKGNQTKDDWSMFLVVTDGASKNNIENVIIKDLEIDGNKVNRTVGTDNNKMGSGNAVGVVRNNVDYEIKNITISNLYIHDYPGACIRITGKKDGEFDATDSNGETNRKVTHKWYYVENVTVKNCKLTDSLVGVSQNTTINDKILDNEMSGNLHENMTIDFSDYCLCEGNKLGAYKGGCGNIGMDNAIGVIIRNNTIDNTNATVGEYWNSGITINSEGGISENVTIEKNTIIGANYGIFLKDSRRSTIEQLKFSNKTFEHNVTKDGKIAFGSRPGKNLCLLNNTIKDSNIYGIRVDEVTGKTFLINNNISSTNPKYEKYENIFIDGNNSDRYILFDSNTASSFYGSSGDVDVDFYPDSVKIKKSFSNILNIGKSYQFEATFTPCYVNKNKLEWTSSDTNVLSVDNNGKAVAKKSGTVKLTVKTENGKTDSITVTVKNSSGTSGTSGSSVVKSISIVNNPGEMLVGEEVQLNVSVTDNKSKTTTGIDKYNGKLKFTCSDKNILTVDNKGNVKAIKRGKAKVTVETSNGKKSTVEIKSVGAKIDISDDKINLKEGETKEITAKVTVYKDSKVNWNSSSVNNVSVKSQGNNENEYKAKITAKKSGKASVVIKVNGETAQADISVNAVSKNSKLECPSFSYNTSSLKDKIILSVKPSSETVRWELYTSVNGKSGSLAVWKKRNEFFNSENMNLDIGYDEAQAWIRIYDKDDRYKNCYTIPFDFGGNHGTNISSSYRGFNYNIKCPTYNEKIDTVNGVKSYSISNVKTGVKNAKISYNVKNIENEATFVYVYGNYLGLLPYYDQDNYNLVRNLRQNGDNTFTLLPTDSLSVTGFLVLVDDVGNIKSCMTNRYSSIKIKDKYILHNNTDVFFEDGVKNNKNDLKNIINSLQDYYSAASSIIFLSEPTYIKASSANTCGLYYQSKSFINDGCTYDYLKLTVIHELGHSIDAMYQKFNNKNIISESEFKSLTKEKSYLRDYSYSNSSELWADLFSIDYVNTTKGFNNTGWKLSDNMKSFKNIKLNEIKQLYNNKKSTWLKYKEANR